MSKFSITYEDLVIQRPLDSNLVLAPSSFVLNVLHITVPEKWSYIHTTLRNVMWAEVDGGALKISLLARKKPKSHLTLLHISVQVSDAEREGAVSLAGTVMAAAYAGSS